MSEPIDTVTQVWGEDSPQVEVLRCVVAGVARTGSFVYTGDGECCRCAQAKTPLSHSNE